MSIMSEHGRPYAGVAAALALVPAIAAGATGRRPDEPAARRRGPYCPSRPTHPARPAARCCRPATGSTASRSRCRSQPVEGFSAIVEGRRPGEYLAMPDNGFGAKAKSGDFLIRAYYVAARFQDRRAAAPAGSTSASSSSSVTPTV